MDNYDNEEFGILDDFNNNKLTISSDRKSKIKEAQMIAKNTISKTKHISIRLTEKDLKKLKIRSIESGMSYQTLIGILIHQYTENKINIKL